MTSHENLSNFQDKYDPDQDYAHTQFSVFFTWYLKTLVLLKFKAQGNSQVPPFPGDWRCQRLCMPPCCARPDEHRGRRQHRWHVPPHGVQASALFHALGATVSPRSWWREVPRKEDGEDVSGSEAWQMPAALVFMCHTRPL